MGRQPADTLMALLPPVGWADVATKHDLSELERRMDLRFGAMEERFELRLESAINGLRADLAHDMRTYFFAMLTALTVLLGLATTISRLLG